MKFYRVGLFLAALAIASAAPSVAIAQETTATADQTSATANSGWISLWDGKTLDGWKIAEPEHNAWSIKDGAIVAQGDRSHLFYMGDEQPFKNFELKMDVKTTSGSNGGVFIHTQWQDSDWPRKGYEIQVNQTHGDPRKSGSIWDVSDVKETFVQDDEWYNMHIIVDGKRITVKLNDKIVTDFTEEADRQPGADFTRILTSGTIALQAHDPNSIVQYKNIQIKPLD